MYPQQNPRRENERGDLHDPSARFFVVDWLWDCGQSDRLDCAWLGFLWCGGLEAWEGEVKAYIGYLPRKEAAIAD